MKFPIKPEIWKPGAIRKSLKNADFKHSLELGCGTGKNTFWLREPSISLTALDFSEKMLEKSTQLDPENKINFQQTDLNTTWPVPAVNFDLISCSLVLEHIKILDFIFAEANRSLKKIGSFEKSGFLVNKINECFDKDQKEIPRLISFIFEK